MLYEVNPFVAFSSDVHQVL